MSIRSILALLFVSSLAACANLGGPRFAGGDPDPSRQILVTALQPQSAALGLAGDPVIAYSRRRGYGAAAEVDRLLDHIASDYGMKRLEGWPIASLGIYCEVYVLAPGQDDDTVLRQLRTDPRVESAQPMNVFATQGISYDDPFASMQPALAALALDAAHERATGMGVSVAVIDSFVDDRHPEIRGRVPIRRNLASSHKLAGRAEIHGTAMAGVIASAANNAEGIVGVAPDADIISLRACWTVSEATGRAMCSSLSLAQSLEAALTLGVDIINLSLAGPPDPLLARLIDMALGDGIIVVAALPEVADEAASFPASHPGVIAARASAAADGAFPNILQAPASEVLSTTPDASYAFFSGNSMAAAFIAGVAALVVEQQPEIDGRAVLELLSATSTGGSINACRAVEYQSAAGSCPATAGEASADGVAISRR